MDGHDDHRYRGLDGRIFEHSIDIRESSSAVAACRCNICTSLTLSAFDAALRFDR